MRLAIRAEIEDGTDLLDVADAIAASFRRAINEQRESGVLRDPNGNTFGEWEIEPDEEPVRQEIEVRDLLVGDRVVDTDGEARRVLEITTNRWGNIEADVDGSGTWWFGDSADTVDVLR